MQAWPQFRELSRLFFGRFFENDLLSPDADSRGSIAAVLGLLAMPGLFIPLFEWFQFNSAPLCFLPLWARDLASMPDKVMYAALSMTALGIGAVLEWDAVLPDRRDVAVLRPLAIRLSTLFAAKVWALVRFWLLFTAVMNGLSFFFFPIAVIGKSTWATLLWFVRAHLIAILAASAFMFLAVIAVQGILMTLLGWRRFRQIAPYVQSGLVALLLLLFFLSVGASTGIRPSRPASALMLSLPPVWFLGLYQYELGWNQAVFRELAAAARMGLVWTAGVALVAYTMSYRRIVTRLFEEPEGTVAIPGRLANALSKAANLLLLRAPAERAAFYFVWHTLQRSRRHRVLVAMYAGVGFALVFQSLTGLIASGSRDWWRSPSGPLLPVPLILAVFLLSGLRYSFSVPSELGANWLFQVAGNSTPGEYLAGVRKAALVIGLGPPFLMLLAIHVPLWGWGAALCHVAYGALVAWLLLELMLVTMPKIPFTCSLVPGKANLKASWPFYVGGYLIYVSAFSALELWIDGQASRLALFAAAAIVASAGIGMFRRHLWAGEFRLVYDERPEPAVRTLDLGQ